MPGARRSTSAFTISRSARRNWRNCASWWREPSGQRVLEIACGTGYWTEVLARTATSVMATDLNDEVLEIARRKPDPDGKVRFQREDTYHLPAFKYSLSAGLGA